MMNRLEQLKQFTEVVADTGDIREIAQYRPLDATTNPSLLYRAAQLAQYNDILQRSVTSAGHLSNQQNLDNCIDEFAVLIAKKILQLVPGKVSIEIDAKLAFDSHKTIHRTHTLISRLTKHGVDIDRVLIKIAATWEGIQAAKFLEQEGIRCNLTLVFGFHQALACADAGVHLISPFVGRILDWHQKTEGRSFKPDEDPGVVSVKNIYRYYKQHNVDTVIMGASFRNIGEIEQLAGCDKLTISPALLQVLSSSDAPLERMLPPTQKPLREFERTPPKESDFRWALNQDTMATEKLAEGIRNFSSDQQRLEQLIFKCAETADINPEVCEG